MRKIISKQDTGILIPVGRDFTEYSHMLRPVDRENVADIADHLRERGFTPYLGGSVVHNWIFSGSKLDYGDVDMLAIGEEPNRLALVQALRGTYGTIVSNNALPDASKKETSAYEIETRSGTKRFGVIDEHPPLLMAYMNGLIDERFILKPHNSRARKFASRLGFAEIYSDIDISLVSGSKFEQSLKE
jgi:hypothetical protein